MEKNVDNILSALYDHINVIAWFNVILKVKIDHEINLEFSTVPYTHSFIGRSAHLQLGIIDLLEQPTTTVHHHRSHLLLPEHTECLVREKEGWEMI